MYLIILFSKKLNTSLVNLTDNDLRRKIEGQSHVFNQLQKYEQNEASNLRIIQQAIGRNKADQVFYLKEKIQKVR